VNCEAAKAMGLKLVEEEMSSRRLTEESKSLIRTALRDFLRWASQRGTPDFAILGRKELISFHLWLCGRKSTKTGEPLSSSTINGRFHAVGLLYSCAYRSGLIQEIPTRNLDLKLPEPSGWKRRPLTREEITRFLERIDTTTPQGLKDRTIFELIYSSGLRVNEAACLKVGDIDFDRRQMMVRGKFDRDRVVPVSEVATGFLRLYLGERISQGDAWVFLGSRGATKGGHLKSSSISERFRDLLRRFGMDKREISTHSVRHSTATHLLENGASVRHVQELLGHSCIESTVRYTHVMIDGLAKVYRRHHPRDHELFEVVDQEYDRRLEKAFRHRESACPP